MSVGANHCAVVTMDGRLVTWGANDHGQVEAAAAAAAATAAAAAAAAVLEVWLPYPFCS